MKNQKPQLLQQAEIIWEKIAEKTDACKDCEVEMVRMMITKDSCKDCK